MSAESVIQRKAMATATTDPATLQFYLDVMVHADDMVLVRAVTDWLIFGRQPGENARSKILRAAARIRARHLATLDLRG